MKFKNIKIISDFLMTKESEQKNNVKWVCDLLSRPIEVVSGQKPSSLVSSDYSGKVSRKVFFEEIGVKFNPTAMQLYFSASDVNAKAKELIKKMLPNNTLYIGYELSPPTREILDQLGYTYVDIWLHPIRYMDDVLFAFRSNCAKINNKLNKLDLDEENYYLHASYLKVQSYKGFKRSTFNLKNGSALFVGQTLQDKAVFRDGKMLTLLDFKKEFNNLTKEYKKVYYSRHPFVKTGDEYILDYISKFNNVEIIDKPVYEIITRDEIAKVVTISSSAAYEAKYFGKNIEYYFKPPVSMQGDDKYYSIYNLFTNHFLWSEILSTGFNTRFVNDVSFSSNKDKLRDALSFYWGYRNIDKVESLKITVGNLFKKKPEPVRLTFEEKLNNPKVKLISFDIFDTLIKREVGSPRDIFRLAQMKLATKYLKAKNFTSARIKAEEVALAKAKSEGRQDTTFDEIYDELSKYLGISNEELEDYKRTELELETKAITVRAPGKAMYDLAVESGKPIVLTSDMYLSKPFLDSIMSNLGLDKHYRLYVSSEYGLRKHEGALYQKLLNDFDLEGPNILHIGDNLAGDIESAKKFGIDVFYIPRGIVNFEKTNPILFDVYRKGVSSRTAIENLFVGQYVNRYFDDLQVGRVKASKFNKSKEEFGYMAMGPFIVGFANWIYEEAKSRGFDKLLFLSRDSKVVMDTYNVLFGDKNDAVKGEYVFASRRASKVQSITCEGDINSVLAKFVYTTTIDEYLFNHFGLSPEIYGSDYLETFGVSRDLKIGNKFDKDKLRDIVFGLKTVIFENSINEHEAYKKYLSEIVGESKRVAVVDIGYAGTMQAHMSDVLGQEIKGLYFITFNTALENVKSTSIAGYLGNLVVPNSFNHTIATHRFIYEGLICSDGGSFLGCKVNGDSYDFIFDNQSLLERADVVRAIHGGVLLLANDLKKNVMPFWESFEQCGLHSTRYFDAFIKTPSRPDTTIVAGVEFIDAYGPTSVLRVLVPSLRQQLKESEGIQIVSIWEEGKAVNEKAANNNKVVSKPAQSNPPAVQPLCLKFKADEKSLPMAENRKYNLNLSLWLAKLLLSQHKYNKLINNPDLFFGDSSSRTARIFEKMIRN